MRMQLEDIIVYTLTGKRHLYKLGDMAYGEWLIFKDNMPVFYLNIFDKMYENVAESIKKDPRGYLEKKIALEKSTYSLNQNIHGIWSSKVNIKWFELEQLPVSFFENHNHTL